MIPQGGKIAVVGPFDKVALLKEACGITQDLVKAFEREGWLDSIRG